MPINRQCLVVAEVVDPIVHDLTHVVAEKNGSFDDELTDFFRISRNRGQPLFRVAADLSHHDLDSTEYIACKRRDWFRSPRLRLFVCISDSGIQKTLRTIRLVEQNKIPPVGNR